MLPIHYIYSDKALNILSLHFSQLTKYLNNSFYHLEFKKIKELYNPLNTLYLFQQSLE